MGPRVAVAHPRFSRDPIDAALSAEVVEAMSPHERCPQCSRQLINSRFDATFRLDDDSERLCFGIPGGLCEDCHQLYIDPELIELLDVADGRCVFAIESDAVLQEQLWSSAD
jgi:hypothetical protein